MMKKIYFLFLTIISFGMFKSQSPDAGIFESYAILNINSAGNTYYDMQATTANLDFNGANLGTFTNAESIVLAGGEIKTFKNNGGDVTGGKIYYKVYKGAPSGNYASIDFAWIQDLGNGDQKWGVTSGTTNMLTGLSPGNYTLEVYAEASTSVGTKLSDNSGANYKATFTVTPTLGVININNANFKPFVTEGKFYTPKKGNLNIQVLDFSGRVMKSFTAESSTAGVELNLSKKGNYILKVDNDVIKFTY